jgi:Kdo2-lipid IVA lauroyltransferase/acyltransferase
MIARLLSWPFMGILWLIGQLPWPALKILSRIIFVLVYYFPGYRKDIVTLHLIYALPDVTGEELHRIKKAFYLHFSELIVEIIKGFFMSQEAMKRQIHFHPDAEAMIRRWEAGQRHVVMLMGHYGNWEWANLYGSIITSLPSYGVYSPMSSKVWNDYFLEKRCRWNSIMLPPKSIKEGIQAAEQRNAGSLIGLVADQSPTGRKNTFQTRFLGLDTSFFTGPEFLSRQLGADVVYVSMKKLALGRYEISFIHIADTALPDTSDDILPAYVKLLETDIHAHPEWWIWTHKRWKDLIKY